MFNCNAWLLWGYDKLQHHPQPQNIWVQARRTAATVFFVGCWKGLDQCHNPRIAPAHHARTSKCRLWWQVHAVAFAVVLWKTSNTGQCHCSVPRFKMPIIFRNKSKTICLNMCLRKNIGWLWKSNYLFGGRRRFWDTSNIKVVFRLRVCSHCTGLMQISDHPDIGMARFRKLCQNHNNFMSSNVLGQIRPPDFE